MLFLSTPGLPAAVYRVRRHTVTKNVNFPYSFCSVAGAWGRGVGTTGYDIARPNFGSGFCEIVPGTQTNTSATLRTYVYEVFSIIGQRLGFYPTTPANVTFAYTVLGQANDYTIAGPDRACPSATYSITGLPAGATVSWSTTGGINVPAASNGTSVVVSSGMGSGILTANITTACGSVGITKNLNQYITPVIPDIIGPNMGMNLLDPKNISVRDFCVLDNTLRSMMFIFPGATNIQAFNYNPYQQYVAPPQVLSGQ